jgi:hypothetical protein
MLYVERWLKAPMRMPDGTLTERTGSPRQIWRPLLAE